MRALTLLLLCALVPATLVAQGTDARLAARLDATTLDAVSRTIAAAADAGLPTEPLVDKALEGASRGAANQDKRSKHAYGLC